LNRAAEDATKAALPIFADAITNMTIQDGFKILNGGDGAATKYLRDNTTAKLTAAFAPKVAESINKVKLTEYWNPIITKYNSVMAITGGQKMNPDLNAFVTERAILGLFKLVEQEENKIRKDPMARVTDILVKVFGSITGK
jgi:enolase